MTRGISYQSVVYLCFFLQKTKVNPLLKVAQDYFRVSNGRFNAIKMSRRLQTNFLSRKIQKSFQNFERDGGKVLATNLQTSDRERKPRLLMEALLAFLWKPLLPMEAPFVNGSPSGR